MIEHATFLDIERALGPQGADDFNWAENIVPPADAEAFAREVIFVICNSGMQNRIARIIFDSCMLCLKAHGIVHSSVFGHFGKVAAINEVWSRRALLFEGWQNMVAPEIPDSARLEWLQLLPWIGPITKYHLAKNFGMQVAKPDVHLARLAAVHGVTSQKLCEDLARKTGYKVATVDTLLWRACANGIIDSATGAVRA